MAKFYVGQRVRAYSVKGRPPCEATITRISETCREIPYDILCPDGYTYTASADQLEPLTPPKQFEAITWDEACFDRNGKHRQPEYVVAGVQA